MLNDLDGVTLKDLLTEPDPMKQLTQIELLDIWVKVVKLLSHLHKNGIVYWNIEPEHIFVDISYDAFDDNVIKSHRGDIIEANIDSLLSSLNISSRSVKIKTSSFKKKRSYLLGDRSFTSRKFNVTLLKIIVNS